MAITFSLAFRAILSVRRSEPSNAFSLISSHFLFQRLEPSFILCSVFRATHSFRYLETSSVWHLEPLFVFRLVFRVIVCFSFGVQSHCLFFVWRSEPHFHLDVQSRILSFGVQSHHRFLVSTLRAIIAYQFWHSESRHHLFTILGV